ncbi:competence/damage-inducible protein cinA [Alteribacillus persepolensis]|uniref:Putative competence-damage inducible protein n=1 Tax=Alteribacillus persepolensis TaxID=568899 RepID=A0A1G7YUB2_9BACI|nr:competence/damage-inducible protein A [Alteribacillus persepolensis]SDH00098.1 competence/damage-inducible protein cinA [Alteribacillus persepolensis]
MNAEVIAVGSELLLGQIANTNGQFLSQQLAGVGFNVYRHTVVGDNWERMRTAFEEASERADVVFVTGGLGPTQDDLTKEVIAELTEKPLQYHEETLNNIKQFFAKRKRPMSANNKKQAHCTEGSHVFYNGAGLACGMADVYKETMFILLPGPPRELKYMYEHEVQPYLAKKMPQDAVVLSRVLRFFHIGESRLEKELIDLIYNQSNPTIAPLASEGEVTIRLTAKAQTATEANHMLDKTETLITDKVGHYLYGKEKDTLPVQVVKAFTNDKKTLAAAESLTGGWFGKHIVDVPGASAVFEGSLTAYSSSAKIKLLNISSQLIDQYGTVSKECAEAMAEKARQQYQTDVGISFTGAAGPEALEGKEPGTVWIGIADQHGVTAHELHLAGSRESIRRLAVYYGCWFLLKEKVVNK